MFISKFKYIIEQKFFKLYSRKIIAHAKIIATFETNYVLTPTKAKRAQY
jgi:hypothetical protein